MDEEEEQHPSPDSRSETASTLEATDESDNDDGSSYAPDVESSAGTDEDCVLTNSLMEASENGNYQEFVDLSIGAEDFMLNWSLTVAKTVDIVKFLVEEKECHACLGECYMNAIQRGYQDVVDYIESKSQHFPGVVNDTVGESMSILAELKCLVPGSLVRLMKIRQTEGECTDEDIAFVQKYETMTSDMIKLLKDHFPDSVEAWCKENEKIAQLVVSEVTPSEDQPVAR